MSLTALQASMIGLVAGRAVELGDSELAPSEAAWLQRLEASRGLEVTRDVHRWWRLARLQASLPLTCLLIERVGELVSVHTQHVDKPCTGLFFVQEAELFVQGLLEKPHPTLHPYILPLAQLELAIRDLKRERRSQRLEMPVDPRLLITALLRSEPLPEPAPVNVELDPSLPHGWRVYP